MTAIGGALIKVLIISILMLSVDLRPFGCLMENTVGLQIAVIAVDIACFIIHVTLTKLKKENDEQKEQDANSNHAVFTPLKSRSTSASATTLRIKNIATFCVVFFLYVCFNLNCEGANKF